MKVSFKAAALEFTVTGAQGEVIASHKAENVESTLDLAQLLSQVSMLAHTFKALDATHNVASAPDAEPQREVCGPISILDRSKQAQALIDATSNFQSALSRQLNDVQHDCCMEVYAALRMARRDASEDNLSELCKAANELLDSLGNVSEFSPREARTGAKLRAAIAAV